MTTPNPPHPLQVHNALGFCYFQMERVGGGLLGGQAGGQEPLGHGPCLCSALEVKADGSVASPPPAN